MRGISDINIFQSKNNLSAQTKFEADLMTIGSDVGILNKHKPKLRPVLFFYAGFLMWYCVFL